MARPNYFTCTLGEASALELTNKDFKNIPGLISDLARHYGDAPAAGFAVPPTSRSASQQWDHVLFTFADLERGSTNLALDLRRRHGDKLKDAGTVALISPSTPEFLFTWLALMRLGLAVLHVAPQCQPSAIAHLCSACEISTIFYDEQYTSLVQASTEASQQSDHARILTAVSLPFGPDTGLTIEDLVSKQLPDDHDGFPSPSPTDVAYLHHTSGTSSGVAKPIPQSHRAGAGVLPSFPSAHGKPHPATFTTTPLYHGGIADCFRAWTSGALIWLFPGRAPITARNIVACLDTASSLSNVTSVGYFSSVPYVLQSLEADPKGKAYLQGMDIVGVGGAALPQEVGDRLVQDGVRLISRFGSAECGFLISSHRDYPTDKEWQYLRSGDIPPSLLRFEAQEPHGDDGEALAELVIGPDWPHMAKRNREDGSFATADLFVRSSSGSDAWRYHSRADSQLTLVTGKKFDPAPLEDSIKAATAGLLDDVLIFGNGRPYPGALLFRSSRGAAPHDDAALLDRIWPAVERLNTDSQGHARLARGMLVPMQRLDEPLQKSSKGTVIRGAAEKRFADAIEAAYGGADDDEGDLALADLPDDRVQSALMDKVYEVTGKKTGLDADTDLFAFGVDSVAGIQLRNTVRRLIPSERQTGPLPLDVIEDCGNVERLVKFVTAKRHGQNVVVKNGDEDEELALMLQLVDKYSQFCEASTATSTADTNETTHDTAESDDSDEQQTIVLTGATGSLGAHILDIYSHDRSVKRIYCLARGGDNDACTERVRKSLAQRGLRPLVSDKVVVLSADLGDTSLGLQPEQYRALAAETTAIVHAAWAVNFRMRLRSFERDNIAGSTDGSSAESSLPPSPKIGVTHLLNLALRSTKPLAPRFGFCSSVASALSWELSAGPIPEEILQDPKVATGLGYSKSKWVAEQICHRAHTSEASRRLRGRVVVFRVGQLSGDTSKGIWNASEAWPMMLSTVKVTGALPDLGEQEKLDWLPVDVAAQAIVQGVAGVADMGAGAASSQGSDSDNGADSSVSPAGPSAAGGAEAATGQKKQDDGEKKHRLQRAGVGSRASAVPRRTPVMHVVNDNSGNANWSEMLGWLQREVRGGFRIVQPDEWVKQLEELSAGGGGSGKHEHEHASHPALRLLGLWKAAYFEERPAREDLGGQDLGGSRFATGKTKAAISVLGQVGPVDQAYMARIWKWIDGTM